MSELSLHGPASLIVGQILPLMATGVTARRFIAASNLSFVPRVASGLFRMMFLPRSTKR